MYNSSNNALNLLDLPDEILLIILKKLNMIHVLSSLNAVNRRFDRLAVDYSFVRHFDMTDMTNITSLCNHSPSINPQIVSRICQKILPRIHHLIHRLTIEEYWMKQILLATNYPQLCSLSLVNFDAETLLESLTGMIFNFAHTSANN